MELKDIQTFLNNHCGEQYFYKDLELYKQKFPQSRILRELENAQNYNKAQLDERMCYELLTEGGQCLDCLWEHRGYYRKKDGFIVPIEKDKELTTFEKELLAIDLNCNHKYNVLKALVFGLQLTTPNAKAETYIYALTARKAELVALGAVLTAIESEQEAAIIDKAESEATSDNTDTALNAEANQSEIIVTEPEKKSEDLGMNTQE